MPDDLHKLPLEKIPKTVADQGEYYRGSLELKYRQTKAQIETAEYAKKSVFWMAWSVVVLAAASVASFILDLLTFLRGPGGE